MELNVHLEHDPRFRGTTMYLYGKDKDGEFVIEPMNLVRKPYEPSTCQDPTLVFNGHDGEIFLQSLADALVRIGFRPNELKAKEGELSAKNYHLEDMRRLVFKTKPIKEGV